MWESWLLNRDDLVLSCSCHQWIQTAFKHGAYSSAWALPELLIHCRLYRTVILFICRGCNHMGNYHRLRLVFFHRHYSHMHPCSNWVVFRLAINRDSCILPDFCFKFFFYSDYKLFPQKVRSWLLRKERFQNWLPHQAPNHVRTLPVILRDDGFDDTSGCHHVDTGPGSQRWRWLAALLRTLRIRSCSPWAIHISQRSVLYERI